MSSVQVGTLTSSAENQRFEHTISRPSFLLCMLCGCQGNDEGLAAPCNTDSRLHNTSVEGHRYDRPERFKTGILVLLKGDVLSRQLRRTATQGQGQQGSLGNQPYVRNRVEPRSPCCRDLGLSEPLALPPACVLCFENVGVNRYLRQMSLRARSALLVSLVVLCGTWLCTWMLAAQRK